MRLIALIVMLLLGAVSFAQESSRWQQWGIDVHGFADLRFGSRLQDDATQRDTSLAESRLQLDLQRYGRYVSWQVKGDFVYDDVAPDHDIDLEAGRGWFDLREANLLFTPLPSMDVKLGRQVLTWGTGDLLFINDLFPKDWQSFFTGRDETYLKAPSDAIFISWFPRFGNLDIAYMPRFDSDRFIRGERLSYWNPLAGQTVGRNAIVDPLQPDEWFQDDEIALRYYRNFGSFEWALYGYDGYWKSPAGFDAGSARATFPRLRVYGSSLRGPVGSGLINLETGYYDSRDDGQGDDPLTPNSEWRFLVGYEREIGNELTLASQAYTENLLNYRAYRQTNPPGAPLRDEWRALLTLRLTKQLLSQTLRLSLFSYWSPTDQDAYIRPHVRYKWTDAWELSAGGNLFLGREPHTFFGQFEDNSNLYGAVRWNF